MNNLENALYDENWHEHALYTRISRLSGSMVCTIIVSALECHLGDHWINFHPGH